MLSTKQQVQLLKNVADLVESCDDYPQFSFCFESFEDEYMPEELEDREDLVDEIAGILEKVGTIIDTILTSVCNTYRKYDALEYVDKFTFGTKEDRQELYYNSFGGLNSTPEEEDPEDIDDEDSARWAVWDEFTTAQYKHDVLVELNRQIQELEQQQELQQQEPQSEEEEDVVEVEEEEDPFEDKEAENLLALLQEETPLEKNFALILESFKIHEENNTKLKEYSARLKEYSARLREEIIRLREENTRLREEKARLQAKTE